MAWLTSNPEENRITTSRSTYWESRTNAQNPDNMDVRKIIERVSEWRGLTRDYSASVADSEATISANYTRSYNYYPIGGGGYNLVMIERWIIGEWIEIQGGGEGGAG